MDKAIVFENWQALRDYLEEIAGEVWAAMENDGYTYEDGFNFVLRRLRDKAKEDFGNDIQRTA